MPDLAQENTKISRREALKKIGGIIAGATVLDAVPAWTMGSLTEGRLDQRTTSMLKLKEIGDPKVTYIWAYADACRWGAKLSGKHLSAKLMNHYLDGDGSKVDISRDLGLDISNNGLEGQFWDGVAAFAHLRLMREEGHYDVYEFSPSKLSELKSQIKIGYPFTFDVSTVFSDVETKYYDWFYALGKSTGLLLAERIVQEGEKLFLVNPSMNITDKYAYHKDTGIWGIFERMNQILLKSEKDPTLSQKFKESIRQTMVDLEKKETKVIRLKEKDLASLTKYGLAHEFDITGKIEKAGKVYLGRLVA